MPGLYRIILNGVKSIHHVFHTITQPETVEDSGTATPFDNTRPADVGYYVQYGNGTPYTRDDFGAQNHPSEGMEAEVDMVFLHDITEDRDTPWKIRESKDFWPTKILAKQFPGARIFTYGYDTRSWFNPSDGSCRLVDILDRDKLRKQAERLANTFPVFFYDPSKSKDAVNKWEDIPTDTDQNLMDAWCLRPIVFFAHGYGGLIYEQMIEAAIVSQEQGKCKLEGQRKYMRRQGAFLFNTPHSQAGLAEWAFMSAKQLGMPGIAESVQKQDWTEAKVELRQLTEMQESFFTACRADKLYHIACCFATKALPNSDLMLPPEWALIPDATPISIDDDHFGMTRFRSESEQAPRVISAIISRWVSNGADPLQAKIISHGPKMDFAPSSLDLVLNNSCKPTRALFLPAEIDQTMKDNVRLGSIVRVYSPLGYHSLDRTRFEVIVSPESYLSYLGCLNLPLTIEATDEAKVSYDTLRDKPECSDLNLWRELTTFLRRRERQVGGILGIPSDDADKFTSITTKQWMPSDKQLIAISGSFEERPNLYIIYLIKVINGASVPVLESIRSWTSPSLASSKAAPVGYNGQPGDILLGIGLYSLC